MLQKAKPRIRSLIDIGQEYTKNLGNVLSRILIDTKYSRVGKVFMRTIPVLSIFAFLGMSITLLNPVFKEVPVTYAESSNNGTSASLMIDNGAIVNNIAAAAPGGDTAYVSHIVKVTAGNIEDYALTITGPAKLTGSTTVGATDGTKTGANLADNTWGFAWDSKTATEANMTYRGFNGAAQAMPNKVAVSNNQVDFERKLAFAAKFGDKAVDGHYTASVALNLTATPKVVADWNSLGYLQEMTPEICASAPLNTTKTVKDERDQKEYTIARLGDNRCWMTQNLALDLNDKTFTPANSDITTNWPSRTITVNNVDYSSASVPLGYYNEDEIYDGEVNFGYYYSWSAAAAGTAADTTTAVSICPKGWVLPTAAQYDAVTGLVSSNLNLANSPYSMVVSGYLMFTVGYGMDSFYVRNKIFTAWVHDAKTWTVKIQSGKQEPDPGVSPTYLLAPIRCIAYSANSF